MQRRSLLHALERLSSHLGVYAHLHCNLAPLQVGIVDIYQRKCHMIDTHSPSHSKGL
jgi:hypothetical protein